MEKTNNQYLLDLYYSDYKEVPKSKIINMTSVAIDSIGRICNNYSNVCVGYSAGKDSIVVLSLLEKANIKFKPVLWQTIYQFPQNQEWIKNNGPKNLVTEIINRPNWNDIENDGRLLFTENKWADNFYMSFKWKDQQKYLKDNKHDLFVVGRRLAESNNCGSKANNYVRNAKFYDVFSPIAEWKIEDIIAYIRYNNLEVPWQYLNTPNGFSFGSVAWTERRRFGFEATVNERWHEIYSIDSGVVEQASEHLSSAKLFLKGIKRNGKT